MRESSLAPGKAWSTMFVYRTRVHTDRVDVCTEHHSCGHVEQHASRPLDVAWSALRMGNGDDRE